MMVHPSDTPLPFEAPWDAYTAISVCSVNYAPDQLVPGLLQMYYGGFTDQVYGDAPLNLHFPITGRDAVDVVVHRYEDGRLMGSSVETLTDGGTLVIETGGHAGLQNALKSVGIWFTLIFATVFGLEALRARTRQQGRTITQVQS